MFCVSDGYWGITLSECELFWVSGTLFWVGGGVGGALFWVGGWGWGWVGVGALFDNAHCYYFAGRFSFVESFEIQSFNIRNDVTRMKYWMKQGVNQSNMKILLDEPENLDEKFARNQTWFFLLCFWCYFCVLLNRSNISSNIAFLLCWMKCWIGLTRPVENFSTFTGKKSAPKSLFK